LTATSFEPIPSIPAGAAHGYFTQPGLQSVDRTRGVGGGAWASGAIVSHADDVASFYTALLGGRLLQPELLQQMQTILPGDSEQDTGLGLFRFKRLSCGEEWGYSGRIPPSYSSAVLASRDGHRVAVVLANSGSAEVTTAVINAARAIYCHG
jgi:D-alanyl-D-alanine carboxypeptidase